MLLTKKRYKFNYVLTRSHFHVNVKVVCFSRYTEKQYKMATAGSSDESLTPKSLNTEAMPLY